MAGTDVDKGILKEGPCVILAEPQLGENIGTAARAMANFGLFDLRLVRPRDGWPSEKARSASSGADWIIDGARLFDTVEEAIADLSLVYATTARPRDMIKPVASPQEAAISLRAQHKAGNKTGLMFGRERWGLNNDEVSLCDAIVTIPTNPGFSSLNLAQSVVVLGYAWILTNDTPLYDTPEHEPASKEELVMFFEHFEESLDQRGFFKVEEKKPGMVRNLRNMLQRARLTSQEVRTLRGAVRALTHFSSKGVRRSEDEV